MSKLWSFIILLLTGFIGYFIVFVLSIAPLHGLFAVIGLSILFAMLITQPFFPHFYLGILGLTLSGYAFFGRGFAYLGSHPVYVGECILALGCIGFLFKPKIKIFRSSITWLLLLLISIGFLRTIPYIQKYGIDSLRDASLWGYGIFALLSASFLLQLKKIWDVVITYQRWIPWLLLWIPIALFLYNIENEIIPRWSRSDVPVLNPKAGDIAVHLSGIIAFLTLGLHRFGQMKSKTIAGMKEWFLWSLLIIGCIMIFYSRSAILTVLSTSLLILVIHPSLRWAKPVALILLLIVVFFAFNLNISFDGDRFISPASIMQTVQSIFSFTGFTYYDGSRQWRIEWWRKIFDYTLFGEFFWNGKGYGINLANDDGFQVFDPFQGQPLRSPHNSHLTFLARSGVPGFLVWLILQGMFCIGLFRAFRKASRLGRHDWAVLNLWVLTYWFAFIVNATFDVFLEGPQGGIWFWCLFGFGIALLEVQRKGYPPSVSTSTPYKGSTCLK